MAKSFFERLTGSVNAEEEKEEFNRPYSAEPTGFRPPLRKEFPSNQDQSQEEPQAHLASKTQKQEWLQSSEEGQLTIDMYQTANDIVIQSAVAGVKPDDLDVSITQDMVTIRGKRQKLHEAARQDFHYQELYWGIFSRSVLLPQEIDDEAAEANLKNGLLTIRLPKLDKNRVQKLKVKME